jgi:UDP-N-acetylmuramate: L-alanyl-gamma-D-glutamyl-meso-diaminopimelate ligase
MTNTKRIHFIAIGGSVMHNLAIALHQAGHQVSGTDDEINEPSKSKLAKYGLLPSHNGWQTDLITPELDAIVLGMHAKADNPELVKAQALNIPVYSFPDFIREQSANKQRVVIAGSHGKTTITAIIIHILNYFKKDFDYLVGAQIEGLELTVKLSDAPIIIIEGDEYLTSPIDRVPKFLKYDHHIALISGIEWDHMNVFPTFEDYVKQFDLLADKTPKAGSLVYCEEDNLVTVICAKERADVKTIEYKTHPHEIVKNETFLIHGKYKYPIKVFGKHNMQNIAGAFAVLQKIGVSEEQCYEAIQSFNGAARRLQLLGKTSENAVFLDFAHAPSKVKATCRAVKKQFADHELIAVLELHTFSSLNKAFLIQYAEKMNNADKPYIFISPHTLQSKGLPAISESELQKYFDNKHIRLIENKDDLIATLKSSFGPKKSILLMTSGNFRGLDTQSLTKELLA